MKQFHMISGFPRSGSTLLCQILNMNPEFYATPTSPILDMLQSQQGIFSHNPSFKAVPRMDFYDNFKNAQNAFLHEYYPEDKVVFDKNRGWPIHLMKLDEILGHSDAKVIWTYRDPIDVVASMESRHRATPLMQFIEEGGNPQIANTYEKRVQMWINDNGIVAFPGWSLHDAIQMGYEDRILIVDYYSLCNDTQTTMDDIHKFLGLEEHQYDTNNFEDLVQTTHEYDTFYNHKYTHDIVEGGIKYKESTFELLDGFKQGISERFKWVNEYAAVKTAQRKGIALKQSTQQAPVSNVKSTQSKSNKKRRR